MRVIEIDNKVLHSGNTLRLVKIVTTDKLVRYVSVTAEDHEDLLTKIKYAFNRGFKSQRQALQVYCATN